MLEIRPIQVFLNRSISDGQSIESDPINLIEIGPMGNFGFQYTKSAGGGRLFVTHKVSSNGVNFDDDPNNDPDVGELLPESSGYAHPQIAPCTHIKFIAEAIGGDITDLNAWVSIN